MIQTNMLIIFACSLSFDIDTHGFQVLTICRLCRLCCAALCQCQCLTDLYNAHIAIIADAALCGLMHLDTAFKTLCGALECCDLPFAAADRCAITLPVASAIFITLPRCTITGKKTCTRER